MVASYLVHHSYCATAEAFAKSTDQAVQEELASIKNRQSELFDEVPGVTLFQYKVPRLTALTVLKVKTMAGVHKQLFQTAAVYAALMLQWT